MDELKQDKLLSYIDAEILVGEIYYLQGHGLIGIDRIFPSSVSVRITSLGIDIVNTILDKYHIFLKDRKDTDLNGAYNNILAMGDSVQKRRTTDFHIARNTGIFKYFLDNTNIFDRLLTPSHIQRYKDTNRQIIGQHIKTLSELPVVDRIPKLEDKYMERKASFKFNPNKGPDIEREKAVSKAIAGFSNTDGGILFIGVDNRGAVVGLKNDYRLVKDHNADGFQLELRSSVKSFLKNNVINDIINIQIHKINSEEICEIIVHPSPIPIILVYDGKEEFYVREGNSTKPYSIDLAIEYCLRHFTPQNEY